MVLLLGACGWYCPPGNVTVRSFGGGTASIGLQAEADDGITASGEDTGASLAIFEAEGATPSDDSWVYRTGDAVYVNVCVTATVDACASALVCLESSYLPADWIDGAPHDIAGQSGLYVMGEAKGFWDVSDATITMTEPWSGSATFGAFTWEEVSPECLTEFGATSAEIRWDFDPDVRRTWTYPVRCE